MNHTCTPATLLSVARPWICALVVTAAGATSVLHAEITFDPTWEMRTYDQARDEILSWLDTADLSEDVSFEARSYWPAGNLRASHGAALLERAIETFALANGNTNSLFDSCNAAYEGPLPPSAEWLEDESLPSVMRANIRLYYARWLAQHQLYDELLSILGELKPRDVFDPAGLLFYKMVAHHQLVQPEESRLALEQLMEREQQLPQRYLDLAQLLRRDLTSLQDESLDHVARRMNDVRRRLTIGRAGKQVQVVEKGVVDSLDRMIKKLEQQQQQQSSKIGGSQQSAKPMQDSQLPSMKAPMKVDQRDVGNQSGWGNLPPKEREQALQQIGRDYPAHYRDLIEQYFRELADETSSTRER
ncbi:MAG: hypothetical protein AAGD11_06720 [Planctomycetota bacterium]